jgi:adenylylsulfate kinase-like enzyme
MASRLERHGVTPICALISPYAEARDHVRRLCEVFIEVYVATPLSECERRDVKGLYALARRGDLRQFTGIDDPYEPPSSPDVIVDTTTLTVDEAADAVLLARSRILAGRASAEQSTRRRWA